MTPEEEFRKALLCLKLEVDESIVKNLLWRWRHDRIVAQREAAQQAIDFIRQELRFIEMPYVAAYERSIYNEALCETCRVVDALTPEKVLEENNENNSQIPD